MLPPLRLLSGGCFIIRFISQVDFIIQLLIVQLRLNGPRRVINQYLPENLPKQVINPKQFYMEELNTTKVKEQTAPVSES